MKQFLNKWRFVILGGVLLGAVVFGAAYKEFESFQAYKVPKPVEVTIQKGWGIQKIASELARLQVVSSRFWFMVLGQLQGAGFIQAGYYRIEPGETASSILERLRRGDVAKGKLVIAEGLTVREIAEHLKKAGLQEIAASMGDATLPQRLGLGSHSLEGYLFPNTYQYRMKDPKDDLLQRIVARGKKILDQEWLNRPPGFALSLYETLIFASIIEKETGNAAERKHISGVFHNRLRRKMKLQSDPTVIYGIPDYNGNITRTHLLTPTPYNTYTIQGLPPTPICNPGQASIHAALHPLETEDLYFVARGDGTHVFSKTLPEHNKNVARFQHPGGG
ncbi:MAG: endolytic transglycosylase MltG [Magnetococcales bacterium]|nr:endolytic transglycosylase MltG [Magnetococcales bacterium]